MSRTVNTRFVQFVSAGDQAKVESMLKGNQRHFISPEIALMEAIKEEHKHIVLLLLDEVKFSKSNLHEALGNIICLKDDWSDVIRKIIDLGADVGKQNENGDTLMHIAFEKGISGLVIGLLLRSYLQKSNVNIVNKKGISLLHTACTNKYNYDLVEKLVKLNSFDVNQATVMKLYTPLHYAVKYDLQEVVQLLINRGANIYQVDCRNSTPLHWALVYGHTAMIDLIISIDLRRENVVDKNGVSHFMAACAASNTDATKEYIKAIFHKSDDIYQDLIDSKVFNDEWQFWMTGLTPLHVAVHFGNDYAVEFLLRKGADCCNIAQMKFTPHSLAQWTNNKHIEQLLKQHCELMKKIRELRANDTNNYMKWGKQYEESVVLENVETFKHLQKNFDGLRGTLRNSETPTFDRSTSGFIWDNFLRDCENACV